MTKKIKVEFEEGWADEMDLTQEEYDALVDGIMQLVETGEIFEQATPVSELPEDEQTEIIDMLERKKNASRRH
jgi:hypothetical protein